VDSKERVAITLAHEVPDRMPINFRAVDAVCKKLQQKFEVDYEGLLRHWNVDFREVIPPYIGPKLPVLEGDVEIDIWGVGRSAVQHPDGGRDVMVTHNPLADADNEADINNHQWPKTDWFDFDAVPGICKSYSGYALSSQGIHVEGWHGIFHMLTYLFGMEKGIMYLAARPDLIEAATMQIMKFFSAYYQRLFESGNGDIDLLFYKDDFGSQNNLLISQKMVQDFFMPHTKNLCDLCSDHGVKFIQHSCGAVYKIIPDFIEAGVSVLDPIQVTAKGMDVVELKKNFGADLVFHGGIDTQRLMPFGTVDAVKKETRRIIEVLGKDGGYFFSPSHRFQADTPIENIIAAYDVVEEYL
jgi:uroporphyrinogen decarboxylase